MSETDADGRPEPPKSSDRPSPEQVIVALRAEVESLRLARDEAQDKLRQIAQVIGAQNTDRILHDVRNVMNELVLLRSLSDLD